MILYDGISAGVKLDDREGLQAYLNKVWQARPLILSDDDDEEMRRGVEQKFFSFGENTIQAKNYVGFVQYGGQRINVYPRVFCNHPSLNASEDAIPAINHVLKWLSYSSRNHFPFTQVPLQLTIQNDWLEALTYLFANYTSEVLTSSPYFAYQEVTEDHFSCMPSNKFTVMVCFYILRLCNHLFQLYNLVLLQ